MRARAGTFRGESLDCVVSSPMRRARCLASAIVEATHAPLRIDDRFTEIGQGPWEGLFLGEIKARYGQLYAEWHTRPDRVTFPRGESLADVSRRATSALTAVFDEYPRGNVAIVSHSVVIQVLVARALHLDFRYLHSVRILNASVSTLCGTGGPGALLALNVMDGLYHSAVAGARAFGCADTVTRRQTT